MARSTHAAPKESSKENLEQRPRDPASYEQALSELDQLVEQMEQGQLPLDRLLDDYKRGAELLAYCRGKLEAVETQVRLLEEGRLKPWTGA